MASCAPHRACVRCQPCWCIIVGVVFAQVASVVVEALGSLGIGLESFGHLLSTPPFTAIMLSIGALFAAADRVTFNVENCNRVRRRVASLLPVLVTIWKRVRQDVECAAEVRAGIEGPIGALSGVIDRLSESLQNYCDAGFVRRAFTSGRFKEEFERAQVEMDRELTCLHTAMSEDQVRA